MKHVRFANMFLGHSTHHSRYLDLLLEQRNPYTYSEEWDDWSRIHSIQEVEDLTRQDDVAPYEGMFACRCLRCFADMIPD